MAHVASFIRRTVIAVRNHKVVPRDKLFFSIKVFTLRVQGPKSFGFRAQILYYEWYLGPKALLFGSSDPKP